MRRMDKEFKRVGLIYDSMDNTYNVVDVTNKFIICVWYSEVSDPELRLYDHNYNLIATQNLYPEPDSICFGVSNKWMSYVFGEDER